MNGKWVMAIAAAVACAAAYGAEREGATRMASSGSGPAANVPNGSFESAGEDIPAGWAMHTWGGKGVCEYAAMGRTGGHSVRVASDEGGDVGWMTSFEVKPYSTYRFTGWIKTENVVAKGGKGALFNLHGNEDGPTKALTGTNDWTEVTQTFETRDCDWLTINCVLGAWGLATGAVWFDDLNLELIATRALKPEAVVDAGKTGAPVSKYIYGQFIEHLGRCIYGGIWAEMLEDRKFFYPIGAGESPWKAVQQPPRKPPEPSNAVTMMRDGAYVGEQAASLTLSGNGMAVGIEHGALGLRQGKNYVGRVIVAGDAQAGPIDVALIWGKEPGQGQRVTLAGLGPEYRKLDFAFTCGGDTDDGALRFFARGKGTVKVGAVSLMPADNVHGMRADTIAVLKELNAPVYRWPGGNFVSGYNWRDGLGDPDKRPPRKNPAWKGVEYNDFGLDEFMTFCRTLSTEPYIVVNSGQGDAKTAVEELQYANAAKDTPMGQLRTANGHPEPYRVKWWGIGNEMYGNWQLGHMPIEEYVQKNNAFADALRAADPAIKLIAVGATGDWSKAMLASCADHMDLLSEHFYCHEIKGTLSHVRQIPANVRAKAEAHRQYHKDISALAGKHIPIALDEWNYWYGPQIYGELGTRYFLKDALGIAAGLHEYIRNSDVFEMANYAQTVNVIGAIKTSKTDAAFETTGLALKLYRQHFGVLPVAVTGTPEPLDVVAAWREDHKALTVGVVNATRDQQDLKLDIQGAALRGFGRVWTITGTDPYAHNEPGKDPQVRIEEAPVQRAIGPLTIPALSVCLFELDAK